MYLLFVHKGSCYLRGVGSVAEAQAGEKAKREKLPSEAARKGSLLKRSEQTLGQLRDV